MTLASTLVVFYRYVFSAFVALTISYNGESRTCHLMSHAGYFEFPLCFFEEIMTKIYLNGSGRATAIFFGLVPSCCKYILDYEQR